MDIPRDRPRASSVVPTAIIVPRCSGRLPSMIDAYQQLVPPKLKARPMPININNTKKRNQKTTSFEMGRAPRKKVCCPTDGVMRNAAHKKGIWEKELMMSILTRARVSPWAIFLSADLLNLNWPKSEIPNATTIPSKRKTKFGLIAERFTEKPISRVIYVTKYAVIKPPEVVAKKFKIRKILD